MFTRKKTQFVFVFLSLFLCFFVFSTKAEGQTRTLNDFKTLFGTNFDPSPNEIKNGTASGILYLGPQTQSRGGFDSDGNLKKIRATISLKINGDAANRPWNMVGSVFGSGYPGFDEEKEPWIEYKQYLRLVKQSFIVRIYQKGPNEEIINESISYVKNSSFLKDADKTKASSNKPLDKIIKFTSGVGFVQNLGNSYEDGYTLGPNGGSGLGSILSIATSFLNSEGSVMVQRQVAVIDLDIGTKLEKGKPAFIDFWYLGSNRKTTLDPKPNFYFPAGYPPNEYEESQGDGRIKKFALKDGDKDPYFKIGSTIEFTTPSSLTEAQTQSITAESESGQIAANLNTNRSSLPSCGILNGWLSTGGSFMGCVGLLSYYALFKPAAWFAWFMGQIFDFFIGYSVSDESYRHNFIQTGWQLVRDISNIFFIVIMIYSGLAAVFSTSNVSYKKIIPTLVINALIINFSLFATRIVIDLSNITARIFYNQMVVCEKSENNSCVESQGIAGYKPISESIVSSFNPQKIFTDSKILAPDDNLVIKDTGESGGSSEIDFNTNNTETASGGMSSDSNRYGAYFTLISLLMAAIAFSTGMMFWKTAFMFVGRVIGLYVAMIFSPFAFLSRGGVPLVSKIGGINYSEWWKDLTNYALLAPIFVFFLYIINAFLKLEFINSLGLKQNTSNFFEAVIYVVIPMLIIYGLLDKGVGLAKRYAGSMGEMAQRFATGAAGVVGGAALGVASGGLAYAGTRFGSRIGRALGQTALGRRAAISVGRAASNGTRASLAARLTNRALNWTQNSSWDARNTRLGGLVRNNPIVNQMGLRPSDRVSGAIGLGQRDFEGGYIAQQELRQKELREEIENIKFTYLNDEQSKKLWKEISDAKVGNDAMRDYLNKTDTDFKNSSDKEAALKKEIKDAQKKIDGLESDIKTNNKLSESEMAATKNNLKTEKENLANKQKEIADIQKLQLQTIENIAADKAKTNKIRETKEYQDSYKDKVAELQKTYGKVESTKDLTNAMRRDYAEILRNNSFWMKDGKQRAWAWTKGGVLGGTLGAMISGGASAAFGSIVSERIRFEQEALDAVTKKYIKDYGKGKGKTSKIDQYKNQLDELNKKLKEVIAAKKGINVDDVNLDDHDLKDQREWVKEHVENLKAEFDARDAEFKDATDRYRKSAKTKADKDAYASASKARKRAEDLAKAAENLWKNKSETEEKIKKEEDQTK